MATQHTQQELLSLFDRIYPVGYLTPMKDGTGPGYEFWQAVAAAFARQSEAVARLDTGAFILTATGGSTAKGSVTLKRATTGGGEITIKAASILKATNGARFSLDEDVVFTALSLIGVGASTGAQLIGITAKGDGYQWNVSGKKEAADGTILKDSILEFDKLVMDPAFAAGLDAPAPDGLSAGTSGGAFEWLDALGSNRGLLRAVNESDASYRKRMRAFLDTVSPAAVRRVLDDLLNALGVAYTLTETFDLSYQTVWDGPQVNIPNTFSTLGAGFYASNTFAYDDGTSPLRPPNPAFNRWLDEADQFNSIIITVQSITARSDVGMGFDDTIGNQVGLQTGLGGQRATCAFDVPDIAPGVNMQGGFDGFDLGKAAIYKGIYDMVKAIKPAGCNHYVEAMGN